jgi:hypothetical protein
VKVRNVSGQVVDVPVDGGMAVAVDGVVDVADEDATDLGLGSVRCGWCHHPQACDTQACDTQAT